MHKNLKQVGQVVFGRGAIGQLDALLADWRRRATWTDATTRSNRASSSSS